MLQGVPGKSEYCEYLSEHADRDITWLFIPSDASPFLSDSRHPTPPLRYSDPIAHMSPSYPSYHITPSVVPSASHFHTPYHAMSDQASQAGWSMHSDPSSLSRGSSVSQLQSELADLTPFATHHVPLQAMYGSPAYHTPIGSSSHPHFLPHAISMGTHCRVQMRFLAGPS